MDHLLLILLCTCGCLMLYYSIKKCRIRDFILSALSGIAALFAADLIGGFFSFHLPINVFTGVLSALGGLPGVILLNLLTVLFR